MIETRLVRCPPNDCWLMLGRCLRRWRLRNDKKRTKTLFGTGGLQDCKHCPLGPDRAAKAKAGKEEELEMATVEVKPFVFRKKRMKRVRFVPAAMLNPPKLPTAAEVEYPGRVA